MYRGIDYQSSQTQLVVEYASRRRLAEMGFTSDLNNISAEKADAFLEIDLKRQQIENEKNKKGK